MSDDIHITLHTWLDDGDEDGYYQELRVNGEVACGDRPLNAGTALDNLAQRKGIFDHLHFEIIDEEGLPT